MKYVVTAFDKGKNSRAIVSIPMPKHKADVFAKSLGHDMLIAKPEYRNLCKIRVEPLVDRTLLSAQESQSLAWEEVGGGATILSESFVIHLN